jgi:hypothetical protein
VRGSLEGRGGGEEAGTKNQTAKEKSDGGGKVTLRRKVTLRM